MAGNDEPTAGAEPGYQVLLGPGAGSLIAPQDSRRLSELYPHPGTSSSHPWLVRANMVASLDGATADAQGRSGGLSDGADRGVFRVLRGLADVVLVGSGTARAEGYGPATPHPDLSAARTAQGRREAAVIVQVSRSGRVEAGRGMFDEPGAALVVIPDGDEQAHERAVSLAGADAVLLAGHVDEGGVDLRSALHQLAERGLTRVLTEGGPGLLGHLGAADLLDELCLTTSGLVVGGDSARILSGAGTNLRFAPELVLRSDATLLSRWRRVG